MLASIIISGFILGTVGSLHCIGMCGPLSLAIPVQHLSTFKKITSLLLYQFGRIITYTIIGLATGIGGNVIYLAGYQQLFSAVAGAMLVVFALFYFLGKTKTFKLLILRKFYTTVQQLIIKILASVKKWYSYVLLGMANGLLPCGMVYIALAATLSFTTIGHSAIFMAGFGAGTLPAMMLVAIVGHQLKPKFRLYFKQLVPFVIFFFGIILVLRGMNLNIPFISPVLPHESAQAIPCH
jgi:uncharacterized protein